MICLGYGLATRTRRPRPSEKIAFRVVFGLSALGDAHCGWPTPRRGGLQAAEGRALHARKRDFASTGGSPHWATGRSFAPDDHVMPRLAYGLATRTHGVRPSEKTAPGVIPGFPPQGHPGSDDQSGGGAGSARPRWHHRSTQACPRLATASSQPSGGMKCLRLRPARIRGRGDRVPPRKPPPRYPRVFPARPSMPWMATPRRGGLRTPVKRD
jgi:hypothetical protein